MIRRLIVILATLFFGPTLHAAEVSNLYHAKAIVTGTEEPERTRGFQSALQDVIVKLTGDARLEHSDKLKPLLGKPHRFVERFEYEDRMKDIPVHDEQGTRERPHYLRVQFKTGAIDAELKKLGLTKWSADRPLLAIWLGIRTAIGSYVLMTDGPNGYGQRAVLTETAARRGLPIALPEVGQSTITFDDIASRSQSKLRSASARSDALLSGLLSITAAGYWDIDWQLSDGKRSRTWALRNVSFDKALKNGLQTSGMIFSGNAQM